jgi:hypothetical protein
MSSAKGELSPNETLKLGDLSGNLVKIGGAVGVLGLAAAIGWGATLGDNFRRFFHSYLVGFMYVLSIGLGALFFVVLHHLVNARWSTVVRRIAEILMAGFPLLFLLAMGIVVPVALGYTDLFVWTKPMEHFAGNSALEHAIHHKHSYLNTGFLAVRVLIYFAIWFAIAFFFWKRSVAQDDSGDEVHSNKMRSWAPISMIAFAFTCAFAAFDFLMTLEPAWFSTIFGVYYFAGCAIAIYATLALSGLFLQWKGVLRESITVEHYHDLGKLLFAFIFFWAYIAFSQMMLIWYANIPEETTWYSFRWNSNWKSISLFLIICHWAIPFVLMMSRQTKRNMKTLAFFCFWMMAMHWVDLYWIVIPSFTSGGGMHMPSDIAIHPIDVLATVGMVGLYVAAAGWIGGKVNLLPTKDPHLGASLKFENI